MLAARRQAEHALRADHETPPEVDEGRRKGEDDDTVVGMEDCIKVPLGTAFHKSQKYGRTHVI
jgi:hypothetical protein